MKALQVLLAAVPLALGLAAPGQAQTVRIGVNISQTGPAASLGIPQANTVALLPKTMAGQPVEYVVLDDASDTTRAVANARKLSSEERVDVILGPSTTPASLAVIEVAAEARVPMIALAGSARIVAPMDEKRAWVFKTAQNDALMARALAEQMAGAGVKTLAFVGFSDAYGDGWLAEITAAGEAKGIKLAAVERYARTDTSVTGQALKVVASKPDAVLVAGAGTPAALPQKALRERGYRGPIYQTHGALNPDFLRIGGRDVEGTVLPGGPVIVAAQLPETSPVRAVAMDYTRAYEAAHGAGTVTTFGAHLYDAARLVEAALPAALKAAKPGTPEFRAALRDAIEGLKEVAYSQGVATMSPTDHVGQDERARVMVTVEDGRWKLLPAAR